MIWVLNNPNNPNKVNKYPSLRNIIKCFVNIIHHYSSLKITVITYLKHFIVLLIILIYHNISDIQPLPPQNMKDPKQMFSKYLHFW